jgi:hypothetical protein
MRMRMRCCFAAARAVVARSQHDCRGCRFNEAPLLGFEAEWNRKDGEELARWAPKWD